MLLYRAHTRGVDPPYPWESAQADECFRACWGTIVSTTQYMSCLYPYAVGIDIAFPFLYLLREDGVLSARVLQPSNYCIPYFNGES